MSQHWYANTPHPDNQYDTDLNNVRAMFETLRTNFSGSSAPSNAIEGMLWRDTNKKLLKLRGVSAWFGLMHGSVNQKIWVYRNDTDEGWVIDSTVTDRVLAVKGGGQAYNVNGGSLAGTWTVPTPDHRHTISADGGHSHERGVNVGTNRGWSITAHDSTDHYITNAVGNHSHSGNTGYATTSVSTWRPAAAVGTLQYMGI